MEKECKYIKEFKQKNKHYRKIILAIVIIIAVIALITMHWGKIKYIFYNDNGNFSNDILWSAFGAIVSVFTIVGVIVTIRYTEHSRRKQNEYEFHKQQLLEEHIEFKKEVKKQLEVLDPIRILSEVLKSNDLRDIQIFTDRLNSYMTEIKSIDYKIYWYYNRTMQGSYIQLNSFISELNTFIEYMEEKINDYCSCLEKYMKCDIYNRYLKIEKSGLMDEEEKNKFQKIREENPTQLLDINNWVNETTEIKGKIIKYRNERWSNIVEKAKLMIEERGNVIKEQIECK